jgi:hypothetical protein
MKKKRLTTMKLSFPRAGSHEECLGWMDRDYDALNNAQAPVIMETHQELSSRSTPTCLPGRGGGLFSGDAADDRQRNGTFFELRPFVN